MSDEMTVETPVETPALEAPLQAAEIERGTVFYAEADGALIGGFGEGAAPPDGAIKTSSAPPDGSAIWDGAAWVTPIETLRQRKTLSKIDFCRALYAAQILPADLVVDAALGKWPSTFEAAIAGLPEAERVDAKLAWAGASHVSRTAPLFLSLLAFFAAKQGLSAAAAEAMGDLIFEQAI